MRRTKRIAPSQMAHLNSWGPTRPECSAFWWTLWPPVVRQVKSHSAEFAQMFLPSMLDELVHYKHLVLSAREIIFITIPHLGFMLQTFMHPKSIFLGTCVITRVTFKRCFLQLLYETDKLETVDPDCTITHCSIKLFRTLLSWMFSILMKHEAIRSPASEVPQCRVSLEVLALYYF